MNVWTVALAITVVVMDLKNQVINVLKVTTVLKEVKSMFPLRLIINVVLVIIVQKEVLLQCHALQVTSFLFGMSARYNWFYTNVTSSHMKITTEIIGNMTNLVL